MWVCQQKFLNIKVKYMWFSFLDLGICHLIIWVPFHQVSMLKHSSKCPAIPFNPSSSCLRPPFLFTFLFWLWIDTALLETLWYVDLRNIALDPHQFHNLCLWTIHKVSKFPAQRNYFHLLSSLNFLCLSLKKFGCIAFLLFFFSVLHHSAFYLVSESWLF